jgi:nicotinamidase/pyrazinamidase
MGACGSSTSKDLFKGRFASPLVLTDEIFKEFDKNGNGELDAKELAPLIKAAFPESSCSPEEIGVLMDSLDTNHDGTVGVNELRAFLRCYDPTTHNLASKSALVIIDVQNDFITGALANPFKAQEIVPIINGMRDKFDMVVISYDYHPEDHCSFVESVNAGKVPIKEEVKEFAPFTPVTLVGDADRAEHTQVLYPRHGVQGSEGCKAHPDLVLKDTDGNIYKGTKPNIDSYSAFFDNCKANDTGLTKLLESNGVTDVYCCGLVFDICVKSSALHGAEMGFKTAVIEEACKPFFADKVEATKDELKKGGVSVLTCAEAEAEVAASKSRSFKDYLQFIKAAKGAKDVHQQIERTTSSHGRSE